MARYLRHAKDLWRAGRKYRLSPPTAAARFYRLAVGERFSPQEIFRLGLLDSGDPLAALSRPVSKRSLLRLQAGLNPRDHFHLTEHKLDFDAACRRAGLPVPPLHAVLARGGRAADGARPLAGPDDLRGFLASPPAGELVIKPATGTHGEGVLVLSRQADGQWNDGGRSLSAADVAGRVSAAPADDWLVQERLFGAAELRAVSGTDLLQTTRVVTLAPAAGPPEVLAAWLRITAGAARADNFNFGAAGHLIAPVDVRSGALGTPARMCGDGLGLEPAGVHPRTGADLVGFRVPGWADVVALVERAAGCFRPLRTVGWDVAVTDRGPVLVEGNVKWDPLPANPDLATAVRRLRAEPGG